MFKKSSEIGTLKVWTHASSRAHPRHRHCLCRIWRREQRRQRGLRFLRGKEAMAACWICVQWDNETMLNYYFGRTWEAGEIAVVHDLESRVLSLAWRGVDSGKAAAGATVFFLFCFGCLVGMGVNQAGKGRHSGSQQLHNPDLKRKIR